MNKQHTIKIDYREIPEFIQLLFEIRSRRIVFDKRLLRSVHLLPGQPPCLEVNFITAESRSHFFDMMIECIKAVGFVGQYEITADDIPHHGLSSLITGSVSAH